jgi:dihydroxyacetone kinase phosphoprotein-dependent L subunit
MSETGPDETGPDETGKAAQARALILDCDGVLADTERYGHLVAFNRTFEEFQLPVRWTVAEYQEKLRIGGGKERMSSLLTPEFIAAARLPAEPDGQQAAVAAWHRRKTAIYLDLVTSGAVPPRPGVARLVGEALSAGWLVAVASTSAEPSVRATLERAVGAGLARRVAVFAGDVVAHKKPAPDIYRLTLRELGVAPAEAVVIEDSRNGLLAATGAGLACLITVNDFTAGEDFAEAALVVTSLGDPGDPGDPGGHAGVAGAAASPDDPAGAPERTVVLANRSAAAPGAWITLADIARLLDPPKAPEGAAMSDADLRDVETVVRTIATVAVGSEKYFGDLDAVVGDGDFGYSMARGFELVLSGWDDFDRTDIGTFLKKVAMVITGRIGGTSGPIWGTAFLRAGAAAGTATTLTPDQVIAMLRAAIAGIMARGKSGLGDKTLLDALVPAVDVLEAQVNEGATAGGAIAAAARTARERAEATREMIAKRGRAAYTGERSVGTLDAGAVAVAVMFEALASQWAQRQPG